MPCSSRALLSVEIRTAANRGLPRPLLSWAFRRSEFTAQAWSETGCPVPFLHASRNRTRRARAPQDTPESPARQTFRFRRTGWRVSGSEEPSTWNPAPKNLAPFRPGIHQDLSSGSPDNSDVLIGNPIRM